MGRLALEGKEASLPSGAVEDPRVQVRLKEAVSGFSHASGELLAPDNRPCHPMFAGDKSAALYGSADGFAVTGAALGKNRVRHTRPLAVPQWAPRRKDGDDAKATPAKNSKADAAAVVKLKNPA